MRRGLQVLSGTVVLAVLATLTVLLSGGATGADAARCARLAVQSQARERLVTGHGHRVVVIGDSYSVGLGLRDPEQSWPSKLPGRVHVFGFSGSGFSPGSSECPDVAYDVREPHALSAGADLVVVEGGLNDTDQPASEVRAGFRRLIGELHGQHVVVVGPPPAPARADGARRVDALLRSESARAGVQYVSMIERIFPYLDDHLHLTPAGHRAFGSIVAESLARSAATAHASVVGMLPPEASRPDPSAVEGSFAGVQAEQQVRRDGPQQMPGGVALDE